MAIPDYQSIMLPLLRLASDKQEHMFWDTVDTLANEFNLTDEERAANYFQVDSKKYSVIVLDGLEHT